MVRDEAHRRLFPSRLATVPAAQPITLQVMRLWHFSGSFQVIDRSSSCDYCRRLVMDQAIGRRRTRCGGGMGRGRARLTVSLLVLGAASGVAGGARAGDAAEAEALIRQGLELRQQGRDAPALPLFQKAYDLAATPRTAGQLGCGEMALGYWLDAEQHLNEALAAPDDSWVAKNTGVLKSALARVQSNLADVAIAGGPAGAKVLVNRRVVGTLPLGHPVRVAKGKVDVEVTAAGYASETRTLQVGGGEHARITANLAPIVEPKKPPAEPRTEGLTAMSTTAPPEPPAAAGPPLAALPPDAGGTDSTGGDGRTQHTVGIGLGIAGGAVLAGAVVETVLWQRKRSQFNTPSAGCFEDQTGRGASGCQAIFDASERSKLLAIVGYAAGGLMAGAAAVLLLTSHPPAAAHRESALACTGGLGAGGPASVSFSCRLVF